MTIIGDRGTVHSHNKFTHLRIVNIKRNFRSHYAVYKVVERERKHTHTRGDGVGESHTHFFLDPHFNRRHNCVTAERKLRQNVARTDPTSP